MIYRRVLSERVKAARVREQKNLMLLSKANKSSCSLHMQPNGWKETVKFKQLYFRGKIWWDRLNCFGWSTFWLGFKAVCAVILHGRRYCRREEGIPSQYVPYDKSEKRVWGVCAPPLIPLWNIPPVLTLTYLHIQRLLHACTHTLLSNSSRFHHVLFK